MGNVLELYQLARCLGTEQPFYGLRSFGLDENESPYIQMADIATHHIKAILEIQPSGPYRLGGHSFGGKVAFEMAQQLLVMGQQVSLLAIFDIQATVADKEKDAANWDDTQYIIELASMFGRMLGEEFQVSPDTLQKLDFEEQLNYLQSALKMAGQQFTLLEIAQIFRVFQANMLAMTQYMPSEVYPHPITLFRTKEIHPHDDFLPDEATSLKDPTWGWNKLSTPPLNFHIVPGNHFTMMMEPHVGSLAQQLRVYLEPIETKE